VPRQPGLGCVGREERRGEERSGAGQDGMAPSTASISTVTRKIYILSSLDPEPKQKSGRGVVKAQSNIIWRYPPYGGTGPHSKRKRWTSSHSHDSAKIWKHSFQPCAMSEVKARGITENLVAKEQSPSFNHMSLWPPMTSTRKPVQHQLKNTKRDMHN
jgi:hypothetical protein